jgi:Trk K+ transport system NAD-binding subunit
VQIMNSANRVHMQRAHADEIICTDQMGAHLLVSSTVNHGISSVVSELLTFNDGSELYRYDKPLSDRLVGTKFADAVQLLAKQGMILMGFETTGTSELRKKMSKAVLHNVKGGRRMIVVNPQVDYELSQNDALFIIAESEPTEL